MGDDDVLDAAALDALRQLTTPGEPDVLAEVLALFRDEVPRRIERLQAALDAGSASDLHRASHSLKGSAGNIGARALEAACRRLDDRARAGDMADAPGLVADVLRELDRVVAEIARLLPPSG